MQSFVSDALVRVAIWGVVQTTLLDNGVTHIAAHSHSVGHAALMKCVLVTPQLAYLLLASCGPRKEPHSMSWGVI